MGGVKTIALPNLPGVASRSVMRRGGIEESVPISGIKEVALALFSRPPRITLRLATPGKFGNAIVFTPPTSPGLEIFGRNPIAEGLKAKVQRAR